MSLERSTLKLGDVELEVHAGGEGQPLLYLHHAGGFRPQGAFAEGITEHFQLIAPSHPGFGASGLPEWIDSIDDFVHVYLDLIRTLDLEDVILVGSSLGGWVAADLLTKNTNRIAKAVLVAPVGIKVGSRDKLDIPDIFAMEPEDLAGCLFHEPEKFAVDPKTLSEAQLEIMARNRQTLALVVWEPYMQNPKLKHRLHLIDRPTLMLRGDHDGLVSREYAEAYAGLIPGAVLETVPGAGHAVEIEKPDAFVERIVEWANG